MKYRSTFFTEGIIDRIRNNSLNSNIRQYILDKAQKWRSMSFDELWDMVFGADLKRTDSVNTEGYCPACGQTVDKYGWLYDALEEPWKVWCPHCGERFPKNDFEKYYKSGLDEHNEFRFELADRSLLFNAEAPDPEDPMHMFGVDDGGGCRQDGDIWIFIGYYLCTGVWCKQIYEGIQTLAFAYLLTNDREYAVRCGILIDRTADLFPKYDYYEQGYLMQKIRICRGYVTAWNVIIRQLHSMLLSYDAIFDAIKDDRAFIDFVSEKSWKYKTVYRKNSFSDIQLNIENRIFGDALSKPWKTEANAPWPDMYDALAKMVLTEWPADPEDIPYNVYIIMWWMPERILKNIIADSTKINGLSGEKGFISYSRIAVEGTAKLLSWISLYDRDIIQKMLKLYPEIVESVRFFIDSWLLCSYYPGCGDTNTWRIDKSICVAPGYANFGIDNMAETILFSYEGFLWKLYELTKDINIIRYMYNSDNYDMEKIFTSDFTLDTSPEDIRKEIKRLMSEYGSELEQKSMDAGKWKLAVLHSGRGGYKRAAYLDYDSGGVHGHNDSMNIGLYAKGMNLLPDIGYPPVHRPGGWHSEFFYWYRSAASHNTVIVDGREHRDYCWYQRDVKGGQGIYSESGKTVLWGAGSWMKAAAADDPGAAGSKRFERLLGMVDLSDEDCYFFDIFRVKGGSEHVKLTHGGLDCSLDVHGLDFKKYDMIDDPFGAGFIRDRNEVENINYEFLSGFKFVRDQEISQCTPGSWDAEWRYSYRYNKMLKMPEGKDPGLLYMDLTEDSEIIRFNSFLDSFGLVMACEPDRLKGMKGHPEIMRPGIAVRRISEVEGELETIFIGIYDPTDNGEYNVKCGKRLKIKGEGDSNSGAAAFEVCTSFGTDLIIAADMHNRKDIELEDGHAKTDADLCILRKHPDGTYKLTMINGSYFRYGSRQVSLDKNTELYEDEFTI